MSPPIRTPFLGVTPYSGTLSRGHPSPRDPFWGSPLAPGSWSTAAPVELADLDLDLVEVGALQDVLGPAVLHQLPQLLQVAADVGRGPEAGVLPALHPLDDLWGTGTRQGGSTQKDPSEGPGTHQWVQKPISGSKNPMGSPVTHQQV